MLTPRPQTCSIDRESHIFSQSTPRSYVTCSKALKLDTYETQTREARALGSLLNASICACWPVRRHIPREMGSYIITGCLLGACIQSVIGHISEICGVLNTGLIGPHLDHHCPAVIVITKQCAGPVPPLDKTHKKKKKLVDVGVSGFRVSECVCVCVFVLFRYVVYLIRIPSTFPAFYVSSSK